MLFSLGQRLLQSRLIEVGVSTFIALFQTHSTSKMFFPIFRDSPLEDLKLSEELKDHGVRLMKVKPEIKKKVTGCFFAKKII